MSLIRPTPLLTAVALAIVGCTASPSGPGSTGPVEPPAGASVVVVLAPLSARVNPRGSMAFSASVTGSADTGVVWSIQEGPAGGSVTTGGVYVAPSAPGTYHVVATAHADPSRFQVATVSVVAADPVGVSVFPVSATVDACGSVSFTATVTGTNNPGVTWSVREGLVGGTVTPEGAYTAPTTAGTYHVVASSLVDPGQSAEAAVIVGPEKVLSVSVTPGSTSVTPGASIAFAATVTTSCGSFAAQ